MIKCKKRGEAMKKTLFAVIMAAVMCFTACGKKAEINIIRNENSIIPVRLEGPRELE